MTQSAPLKLDDATIQSLSAEGRYDLLGRVFSRLDPVDLPKNLYKPIVYQAVLATCCSYQLSPEVFERWLRVIPARSDPVLRYRALIAVGLWQQASKYRRFPMNRGDQRFKRRCATSASLNLAKQHRLKSSFKLYHARFYSDDDIRHVHQKLFKYAPIYREPSDIVILEQGVGDRFLHLAHLRANRTLPRLRFALTTHWFEVVKWLFPEDTIVPMEKFGFHLGQKAHLSGDYLVDEFLKSGSIRPSAKLGEPYKSGPPRFGIVWQGGKTANFCFERRFELARLLDLIGKDTEVVSLQHFLSPEDQDVLASYPNAHLPDFNVSEDLKAYAQTIAGLAGVISVDASPVHVAGLFCVPTYTLMNASSHWYWGPQKSVDHLYDHATTVPIELPKARKLARWIKDCKIAYDQRTRTSVQ